MGNKRDTEESFVLLPHLDEDLENVGGWKATKRQNLVAKLEGRYVGASWLLPSHTHNTHDSSKMWFPIHTQTHTPGK